MCGIAIAFMFAVIFFITTATILCLGLRLFLLFFQPIFLSCSSFFLTYFSQYFAHYLAIFYSKKGFPGVSPAFEHA